MVGEPVLVGLAEVQAINGAAMMTCLGLGSCMGVCALDPVANVSGMAHIMLPSSSSEIMMNKPGAFADTGILELIESMEKLGAERSRMVIAVAGGASPALAKRSWDLGVLNAEAVARAIAELGIKCIATDVVGSIGRTVTMLTETGHVVIRTAATGDSVLCNLRG